MKHQFTIDKGTHRIAGCTVALITRDDGAEWRAWVDEAGKLDCIHRITPDPARMSGRRHTLLKPGSARFKFFANLLERTP